jgi:AbrB family looped-hinge helix DNA binding protein
MYISTVTKQGQISIPIKLRRKLNIDKKKVMISENQGKIVIEPVEDLLDLVGYFKTDKKIPYQKIRQGFENYLAEEAIKGLK